MRLPGIEPGAQAWEARMLPLHYKRSPARTATPFINYLYTTVK